MSIKFSGLLTLSAESPALNTLNLPAERAERKAEKVVAKLTEISIHVTISTANTETEGSLLIFDYQINIPKEVQPFVHWQELDNKLDKEISTADDWNTTAKGTSNNSKFTDDLWKDSCLECFIGKTGVTDYVEINVCPQGNNRGDYAVYHFEDYRTPQPPQALLLDTVHNTKQHTSQNLNTGENLAKARIVYNGSVCGETVNKTVNKSTDTSFYRQFSFQLSQLPANLQDFDLLHPCVILFVDDAFANANEPIANKPVINKTQPQELFYANNHASPPDFHNKDYWSENKH